MTHLYAHNLSLAGDISVNYYMYLSQTDLAAAQENAGSAYMTFWNENTDGEGTTVPLDLNNTYVIGGKTYYKFFYKLYSTQMNDTIHAKFTVNGVTSDDMTYSVKDYATEVLGHQTDSNYTEKLKELMAAMIEYGSSAQTYFNYNTGNLVDSVLPSSSNYRISADNITVADIKDSETTSTGNETATFCGTSLSLESLVTLKVYIKLPSGKDMSNVSVTVNGKGGCPLTGVYDQANNIYYYAITGIYADKLDYQNTISVYDNNNNLISTTKSVSAIGYANKVLTSDNYKNSSLATLMKRMANYNVKINAYKLTLIS